MKTERIIRLFLAVLVLFVMAGAKEVGAVTWCYEDDFSFSTQKAANDNYDSSDFWPEMALPPPHPYLFYSSVIYPGGLGFASYYTEDAFLAYAFPVGGGLVRVDSGTLEVDVLGSSPLSYELSDDGANWTEQSSLVEGHNQIPLLPSDNPFTYIRFVGSDVGIDNLSVTVTGPKVDGTYVFWPRYCSVVQTGGIAGIEETYGIEGQLELTVDFDAGTASFDVVDANLLDPSPYLEGYGTDLGELFDMTELVGTVVSATEIEFDTADPMPGGKVVHLDLTICGIYTPTLEICLTGGFCEVLLDGFCFEMNARAIKKRVFYVDTNATGADDGSSWENAFTDLQDAIDDAGYGCEIWVAKGTYKPTSERYSGVNQSVAFNLEDGKMVYGGFNGTETSRSQRDPDKYETILSGDIDDDGVLDADNAWHVVEADTEHVGPTGGIDGFTVTGGYADYLYPENNGAGIYIHGSGQSPTIANCKIIDNYADISGAGMFIRLGDPNVVNCAFIGNSSGDGGGIACWSGNLTLTNSMFSGNTASGDGGAIACADSKMIVTNCTFAQNTADFMGGGIFCGIGSRVRIYNSILWDNTADFGNHWYNFGGSIVAYYSCVQGNWNDGGQTCTNDDPLFVDPNGPDGIAGTEDDNLRLSADSPCIDAGDINYVPEPGGTDLDGNPRIMFGIVDMGAYEFQGPHLIYVDDDAPNDPGPGDPEISDPNENGTEEHPFDTIQEGIDATWGGDIVIVHPGQYLTADPRIEEEIDFDGKNITLTSINPADPNIVNNTIIGGTVLFDGTEDPSCTLTGFTVWHIRFGAIYGSGTQATISHCNISGNGPCLATVISNCDGIISNCLITDNTTVFRCGVNPVIFGCDGLIKNCTIANNISGVSTLNGGTLTLENCIIYDNNGVQLAGGSGATLNVSYCDIQGGAEGIAGDAGVNWGPGNIDAEPCFVRLGHWDYNSFSYDFTPGDYHLKSAGWRWDAGYKPPRWRYDYVTSRCIDAGNPGSPLGNELLTIPDDPNHDWGVNLRVNMGYYGGTAQASMPPHDWALLADLNNDGIVSYLDLAWQVEDWLATANEQPGDLNRDSVVDIRDFAALARDWLRTTDQANQPPEVYITSPENGGALVPYNTINPIPVEADASDVDGSVVTVEFFANGKKIGQDNDGGDGWATGWMPESDGSFSLTAKATDDDGAKTTSPVVEVEVAYVW